MKSSKSWCLAFLAVFLFILIGLGMLTVVIDPYFHYHKPLKQFEYPISNQRYQNDGIIKHFDYDTIVTGTSLTENFKTSELDNLFQVSSIKVPFAGASFKEINDNLERAIAVNPNIRLIIRGLDYSRLLDEKDTMRFEADFYPTYLYDNNIFNDVKYCFNKSIFNSTLYVIRYTKSGNLTTTFDDYCNWTKKVAFGKESVDAAYTRAEKVSSTAKLSEKDLVNIRENITQNITDLAAANPDIDFYLFFTPYSIYYWDALNQAGTLEKQLEAEKYIADILLQYDNINLFSFFDEFNMITDLDNYTDMIHYSEDINSQMLIWMKKGEHQLTQENYDEYWNKIQDFYSSFDYDALFSNE